MSEWKNGALLRVRTAEGAKVSFVELFFDLVYVFAVTQISHYLLHDLTLHGVLQAIILWFALWLGWQYNAWITNWFDPEKIQIRVMQFAIMLGALIMAAAIPKAFGSLGLVFAICYVAIQVGRSAFVLLSLGSNHALTDNYRRILGWMSISGIFWIAGGLADGDTRILLWLIAILCEYIAPMIGFWLPVMGRSLTSEWTIDGAHHAERCQLFMIVALGETILIMGATLADHAHWDAPLLIAVLVSFIGSLALWWIYFDTSSADGHHAITHSDNPGKIGAYFHYVHVLLIAGVIVCAVGNELAMAHPAGEMNFKLTAVLIAGPALYLFGNALYKKIIYGHFPPSHIAGIGVLIVIGLFAHLTDLLMINGLTTVLLVAIALRDGCRHRKNLLKA
jgi:low temperature requirement protein LtrA